jgi:hypothetical protein
VSLVSDRYKLDHFDQLRVSVVYGHKAMIKGLVHRHALTDAEWHRLEQVLPVQPSGPTSTLGDRLFIDAVLYRAKTGLPWRDLPERFGPWKTVHNRFSN